LLALPTTTTKAIKDIVFRFIIEYNSSSLRDFYWPILGNNNNSSIYFYIWGLNLKDDILACVETFD
jgi:hypothetical protein